ncbi:hypothetical protein E1292_02555 [Nonomuraea deserti]|uniref:DAGKc domain-containing protein n=1 Tax=Nonomuraea deserti TaxID=1848322 RepID=A0A4R4W8F0_9ACTN|nr:hypothetical protein E1292_02555 [Nonomuraea deserti]
MIVDPTKVPDLDLRRAEVTAELAKHDWAGTAVVRDHDRGQRARPGPAGCARTGRPGFACGDDGTVRAVIHGLVGSGVPVAILSVGTSNLPAQNLALGTSLAEGGALSRLRDRPIQVTLRLDDGSPFRWRVRMVLVGDVGRVQGGLYLFPAAEPDDGRLDVHPDDPVDTSPARWGRASNSGIKASEASRSSSSVGRTKWSASTEARTGEGRLRLRLELREPGRRCPAGEGVSV